MLVEMMGRLEVSNGAAAHAYRPVEDERELAVDELAKELYVRTKDAETSADSITRETIKRVLSPHAAVLWAAAFNFLAFSRVGYARGEQHRQGRLARSRNARALLVLRALGVPV
jgi:hypothetical protein